MLHEFCAARSSSVPFHWNAALALFDIQVQGWPENAPRGRPSVIQQLIVIVFRIKNRLSLYPLFHLP